MLSSYIFNVNLKMLKFIFRDISITFMILHLQLFVYLFLITWAFILRHPYFCQVPQLKIWILIISGIFLRRLGIIRMLKISVLNFLKVLKNEHSSWTTLQQSFRVLFLLKYQQWCFSKHTKEIFKTVYLSRFFRLFYFQVKCISAKNFIQ